jgi:predicted ATP-grasp superfamily ATP-dependent carboligase/protein-tyrosine-phosphatase
MVSKNPKILIIGFDMRAFLAVIRSFGRKNAEVHVVSSTSGYSGAFASTYINKIHEIPPIEENPKNWVLEIYKLLEIENFDFIIPCDDVSIHNLSHDLELYNKYNFSVIIKNREQFELMFNKHRIIQFAEKLGIPVPDQRIIGKSDPLDGRNQIDEYPVYLKPKYSFDNLMPWKKQKVIRVDSDLDYKWYIEDMLLHDDVAIQTHTPGYGVGIEFLANEGIVIEHFQHKRIREPNGGGGSSYRKSEKTNAGMLENTRKLIKEMKFSGVGMAEFRYNPVDDKATFLELNSRFWGSLPLALESGVDFPYDSYEAYIGSSTPQISDNYEYDIYSRNVVNDLSSIFYSYLKESNKEKSGHLEIKEFFSNALKGKERWDSLTRDDPNPFLWEMGLLSIAYCSTIANKTSSKLSLNPISRTLRRNNAVSLLSKSENVLFLSKGNICRAPFSREYFKRIVNDRIIVNAAGLGTVDGRRSPIPLVEIAKSYSVDLSDHRSKILTENDLINNDIVITFDSNNYKRVLTDYPKYSGKIFCISDFHKDIPRNIIDPIGLSIDSLKAYISELASSLEKVGRIINE